MGKISSNVMWKFAERILAQIVSLVVSIVLARLLMPEDYGAISMVMVFIAIADVFVTYGLPIALIQKADADEVDFSSVFYVSLFLSVILYLILFCFAPFISDFYRMPIISPVLRVLGIRLIVASYNSTQHAFVSRNMMFKKYFWSTLFGTLFSGVFGIILAYRGFGVWALVVQYLSNTIIDTIVLSFTVNWRPKKAFSVLRVKKLYSFGWKILFEGLSNKIVTEIRSMIIGRVYTSDQLGFYSKGKQFPTIIVENISTAISSVLLPAMSNVQKDFRLVENLLRKSIRLTTYVIFPMLTGLALVSDNLIVLLMTEKWSGCVVFLRVFCGIEALTVGMIPRHQALNATSRSDVYMNEHIVYRIINIALLVMVYRISTIAIVVSQLASAFVLAGIVMFTSKKFNGYSYKNQAVDVLFPIVACLVMAIPVLIVKLLVHNNIISLFLQVIVGMVTYISISYFAKYEEFFYILNYCRRIKTRK